MYKYFISKVILNFFSKLYNILHLKDRQYLLFIPSLLMLVKDIIKEND